MYKLEVISLLPDFSNTRAWDNFCDHLRIVAREGSVSTSDILDDELGKFGATNEFGTSFIIFETEEDATVFVLRWA